MRLITVATNTVYHALRMRFAVFFVAFLIVVLVTVPFTLRSDGTQKGKVQSRIIMTPANLKMLSKALEENVKKFENQFGEIKMQGKEGKNIGFQTINTEVKKADS